ncbi:hypothetical protein [Luteolibacter arcticus]|uniref:hypothetical protein n=1 Tax=Luteolibacter arcticus TaxID=1581411 RepID=UPI0022215A92|nr:hypothetical protein [Luteolibacter arcticus]
MLPRLTVITGLLLAAGPVFAQMAEGLDSADLTPSAPAAAAPAAPAKPAAAPATEAKEIEASRYAGDELPAYVRQLSARFSIRKRQTDPFGRFQDPNHVAPEPKITSKSPTQRFKPEPPMPFSEVVAGISVNGVMPGKQQFLIGNRMFRVSDVFSLRLPNGKQIGVKVLAVNSARIRFLNVSTNETADHILNMLPEGVKKGIGQITAPGVESDDSQAPVDIQPTVPLSTNP